MKALDMANDLGDDAAQAAAKHGVRLEMVNHTEAKRGFVLLPRQFLREPYWPLAASAELGANQNWPVPYHRAAPKDAALREPLGAAAEGAGPVSSWFQWPEILRNNRF